jgi:hypothetical protein
LEEEAALMKGLLMLVAEEDGLLEADIVACCRCEKLLIVVELV